MFLKKKSRNPELNLARVLPDGDLIGLYRKTGNNEYLGELFERYTHLVFGVCMKYLKDEEECKDAVMQVFEILHVKLLEFKIENFKSWIHTVSKNHCLMALRRKKTERRHQVEMYKNSIGTIMESADFSHPSESERREEKISHLEQALEQLREEQKTCIELVYLHKKSYQEVSDLTGYDLKKVKSYTQNGKRNLKLILEKK